MMTSNSVEEPAVSAAAVANVKVVDLEVAGPGDKENADIAQSVNPEPAAKPKPAERVEDRRSVEIKLAINVSILFQGKSGWFFRSAFHRQEISYPPRKEKVNF